MKTFQLILWWVVVNILLPTMFCLAFRYGMNQFELTKPKEPTDWIFATIFFALLAILFRIPKLWIRWNKPYTTTRLMDLKDIVENKIDYYNPEVYNTPFKLHCERLFGNH